MKLIFVLLIAACAVALVYGDLVCGSDYCKKNACKESVAASSCKRPAVYKEKIGGKCACCPACVVILNEGDACKTYSTELGESPTAICNNNLVCAKGTCIKAAPKSG